MNLTEALAYVSEHPEWEGSTVAMALDELSSLIQEIRAIDSRMAQLNSYADGSRPDLDGAFNVLTREAVRLVGYWTEPLDDEQASPVEVAR